MKVPIENFEGLMKEFDSFNLDVPIETQSMIIRSVDATGKPMKEIIELFLIHASESLSDQLKFSKLLDPSRHHMMKVEPGEPMETPSGEPMEMPDAKSMDIPGIDSQKVDFTCNQ